MTRSAEEVVDCLERGESPGVIVEAMNRRRLEYVRTSRPAYHFRIVRGPDEGQETSYYRRTFREALAKGDFLCEDEASLAMEEMGYVRFPDDGELKEIAARIALHAVRNNTPLEDYHAGERDITDDKMKALNVAVTDNIYTLLRMFRSPAALDRLKKLDLPDYWEEPKLNAWFQHDKTHWEQEAFLRERELYERRFQNATTDGSTATVDADGQLVLSNADRFVEALARYAASEKLA